VEIEEVGWGTLYSMSRGEDGGGGWICMYGVLCKVRQGGGSRRGEVGEWLYACMAWRAKYNTRRS